MIEEKYITHKRTPFFQVALNYINSQSHVLDIGAGDGSFAKFCNVGNFYLFDGNVKSIEALKTQYPNSHFGKLPYLPFEDNMFDVVHCSHVIEHLNPADLYDSLVEMDRVLKKGGHIIISTPLLWEGFYDDLSHVKPYSPVVLEKYMCGRNLENLSRAPVSTQYIVVDMVYRYKDYHGKFVYLNADTNFFLRLLRSVSFRLRKYGLRKLEKTGYTIVLQKE